VIARCDRHVREPFCNVLVPQHVQEGQVGAVGTGPAYIAPALKPDGSTNARWVTRSDWDMERRIVATQRTERLFDLYKIYVLAGRPGPAEAGYLDPRRPVDALLEKYAHDTLDTEPPHPTMSSGYGARRFATSGGDLELRDGAGALSRWSKSWG
jgi:hypothetical protein